MVDSYKDLLRRHWAWLTVILTLLLVLTVRIRLRDIPLERDEGEYAYAGQLILQGTPPYVAAYNMKLPGTYAAYACIMAVFGQTPFGIHLGLMLVNALSIVLVFLIGRRILDEIAGAVAAVAFALLSTSTSVFGLAGHATHFVTLFALAGLYLLLRATNGKMAGVSDSLAPSEGERAEVRGLPPSSINPLIHKSNSPISAFFASFRGYSSLLFTSGLCFGLAFLMKQHGIFFAIFGFAYLLWTKSSPRFETRPNRAAPLKMDVGRCMLDVAIFSAALALPYLLTLLILGLAGALHQFIFWTVSYASKYASGAPIALGSDFLRLTFKSAVGPNLVLWILPLPGLLFMWWERRLSLNSRFLLAALFLCSFASFSVGFYFRSHYFITFLPVMALLSGIGISRSIRLLKHDQTIELVLAVALLALFVIGTVAAFIGNGIIWFGMSPAQASRESYLTTMFIETEKLAADIKASSPKNSRVLVMGSEPEIFFLSRRRSATGYIYTYPLMERQSYAGKMQEEMIAEVERARPDYAVYVDDSLSWLAWPESEQKLFEWWNNYWPANFDLIQTIPIKEGTEEDEHDPHATPPAKPKYLLLYKRKN